MASQLWSSNILWISRPLLCLSLNSSLISLSLTSVLSAFSKLTAPYSAYFSLGSCFICSIRDLRLVISLGLVSASSIYLFMSAGTSRTERGQDTGERMPTFLQLCPHKMHHLLIPATVPGRVLHVCYDSRSTRSHNLSSVFEMI